MNVHELREALTDFFSRLHHEPEIARSRADSVVNIVLRHPVCAFGGRCVHEGDE